MISNFQFVTLAEEAGKRLDAVLRARISSASTTLIQRAIVAGDILVDNQKAHKGLKLQPGTTVSIQRVLENHDMIVLPNPDIQLDVLYEDSDLLALNKPAGMPVHPLKPEETGTLANGLVARYPELAQVGDQPLMGGIVHRIDGDTSGLVLAARHLNAFTAFREQFANQSVCKRYVALVAGPLKQGGELVHVLAHQPWRRGRMVDARRLRNPDRPMRAVTAFQPVRQMGGFTLLDVTIFTGVTHQIRCQLALAGHPIVGDALYGGPDIAGFDRHFLHAAGIKLQHPTTGAHLNLTAPLTRDLLDLLATLKK